MKLSHTIFAALLLIVCLSGATLGQSVLSEDASTSGFRMGSVIRLRDSIFTDRCHKKAQEAQNDFPGFCAFCAFL